jgi:carboxypeptidase C (cathepsin A)
MLDETIYSGYLDTVDNKRKIHYVFVAARKDTQTAPLTVWFNGGPGCSSLIGMIQEIGPYIVGNHYSKETDLKKNSYSWNEISNLLFL